MNANALLFVLNRGGPYGRRMADASAIREAAYAACPDQQAREMADSLESVEGILWNRGDAASQVAALSATLIACLLLRPVKLSSRSHASVASAWVQACDDALAAEDAHGCERSITLVDRLDKISALLWWRGDDKHGRAAIQVQRIAARLIALGGAQ
ncbi:hypothetical protein [Caballeronia mineralivorans]|uniref:hypothetical protein n=1 Tax=Caballeronia mineralivorans TaxID=2010198 RepID=UPI00069DD56A|nr:hypothetical protein [Caballeronia mineralivorans]